MKVLATITEQGINPGAPIIDTSDFKRRRAVRAVVLDQHNRVALLYVTKRAYHKLPGGGIDDGETLHTALERELREETGCKAGIVKDIGQICEYRDQWQLYQESYCYMARLIGEQEPPALTDEEQDDGFEPMWADNIDDAIALLKADAPNNYDGTFIRQRDLIFLKAAKDEL